MGSTDALLYIDVTPDFADSECFQVGLTYRIVPRVPSSPQESPEALPWIEMGPILAGSKITAAFRSRPTSWPAGESNVQSQVEARGGRSMTFGWR
jgi:hypothetical protein